MVIHPQFDPVAIAIGPLAIRWYALSYIAGFVLFTLLGRRKIKQGNTFFTNEMLDDLLFWGVFGVILGGRLGFTLFYQSSYYLSHPMEILKVWNGGMSFHGGFLGVLVVIFLFAKKHKRHFLEIADFITPLAPLGLACGRIGNFINGELWGRVTAPDNWWAIGFPQANHEDIAFANANPEWLEVLTQYGSLPRHPSQLYEMLLEGVTLFIILWTFSKKKRPIGQTSSLFLMGYGAFRFIIEFARQPDDYLGLLTLNLSMGQWLSLPMIIGGLILFIWTTKKNKVSPTM